VALFFQIASIVVLSAVGGLLVWLHVRLQALQQSERQLPSLTETMTNALLQAQKGLQALSQEIDQNKLDDRVHSAHQVLQDLEYTLDRSEKLLKQWDERLAEPAQPATPPEATETVTEEAPIQEFALPQADSAVVVASNVPQPVQAYQQAQQTVEMGGRAAEEDVLVTPATETTDRAEERDISQAELLLRAKFGQDK
jgi:paraquat-inducible protein B